MSVAGDSDRQTHRYADTTPVGALDRFTERLRFRWCGERHDPHQYCGPHDSDERRAYPRRCAYPRRYARPNAEQPANPRGIWPSKRRGRRKLSDDSQRDCWWPWRQRWCPGARRWGQRDGGCPSRARNMDVGRRHLECERQCARRDADHPGRDLDAIHSSGLGLARVQRCGR